MEGGFRRLLLNSCVSFFLIVSTQAAIAQDDLDEIDDKDALDTLIAPDIERRTIKEAKIDTEDFEFSMYAGVMGVEDFGTNNVFGGRLSYHINEDFFIEGVVGQTETSLSSFELFLGGNPRIPEDERTLTYYNVSLGINILPGEVYVGKRHAFNTNYYMLFGAGNTEFAGNEYITYSFGGGFRMFTTDWLALRIGFTNHLFTHNIFGPEKSIQNLEATFGLSIYF